jgi:hypothetical protein
VADLKKTILYSGFKNTYKNPNETRKLESIDEYHCVERTNEGRKLDKNPNLRRLKFMSRNLD